MSQSTIQFRHDYGDHLAGAKASLPEPMARHLVDCGLATFVEESSPAAAEPVERAEAPKPKHVQRATK